MNKTSLSILSFLVFFLMGNSLLYAEKTSRNGLTEIVGKIIPTASPDSGEISYVSIAEEIQFWIFALVGIIAVIYIIWVGAKLLWAPGNTEEITTAMKSLGYIVIGLAIIPFAWFIVSFITRLSIR